MTLQKLIYLSMAFVDITAENLGRALSKCKCLEKLILDVACELPVEVAVPTLKLIRVQHPRCVTAAVFTTICQNCTKLETLMVFDSSRLNGRLFITDAGARALLEGCPLLRHTGVEHISGISTALRVELAKRCNLRALQPWDWCDIDDELTREVLIVSPNLTALDCSGCEWLTDVTLAVCAQHCPLLEVLILSGCQYVTNDAVKALITARGAKLRVLRFEGCRQLGDAVIFAMAQHCPLLCRVSLPQGMSDADVARSAEGGPLPTHTDLRCDLVTDAGLTALATHCPKLIEVCLLGYHGITAEAVRALVKSCTHLTIITLPTHLADQLGDLQTKSLSVHFRNR
jgi:hypothetical protein